MTEAPPLASVTVTGLLDALAAATPTPGGGASAAVAGAVAAAQAAMVAAFAEGKPRYEAHAEANAQAHRRLLAARDGFLAAADEDAAAYGRLNAAWSRDRDDPERTAAVDAAVAAPSRMIDLALETLDATDALVGRTSPMLASDLAVAAQLAEAAARAAACSVRVNLPELADEADRDRRGGDLAARLKDAAARCRSIVERTSPGA